MHGLETFGDAGGDYRIREQDSADSWFDFWTGEHVVDSRGQWLDILTPPIDSMAMWVRACTALGMAAGGRLRTNDSVGRVAQVFLYGPGDKGTRACDDGSGGIMTISQDDHGTWYCSEDAGVEVVVYEGVRSELQYRVKVQDESRALI